MAVTKEMRALTKAHEDAMSAHQEETKKLEERLNVARGKPQGCSITLEHLSTDRWRVLFHGLTEEEMLALVEELAPAEKAGN